MDKLTQSKLPGAMKSHPGMQDDAQKAKAANMQNTRSNEADVPPLGRRSIEELPVQDITSTEEGMMYLESAQLTVSGVLFTVEVLAETLFQISMLPGIKNSWVSTNVVRAAAYVLAGLDTDEKAAAITEAVSDQLTTQMDEVKGKAVVAIQDAQEQMWEVLGKVKEQSHGATASFSEGLDKAAKGLSENAVRITETTTKYRDALAQGSPHNHRNTVAPASTSLLAPRVQARDGMRARQVLINIGTESDAGLPEEFAMGSITALKQKLEDVLSGCGDMTETVSHRIKAVTRLRNGGILMELGSDEAVEWFAGADIRRKLLSRVHPNATIKTRDYHIVVQFMPLSFWTGRGVNLRELEEINGMQKGVILHARWIKPVAR